MQVVSKPQNLATKCMVSGEPTANGALFAGDAQRGEDAARWIDTAAQMESEGYSATDTLNLYAKDGVNITVEAYQRGRRV